MQRFNETCCGVEVYNSGAPEEQKVPSCEPYLSEWCLLHSLYLASYRNYREWKEAGAELGTRESIARTAQMIRMAEQRDELYRESIEAKHRRDREQARR